MTSRANRTFRSILTAVAGSACLLAAGCAGHASAPAAPARASSLADANRLISSLTTTVPGLSASQAAVGAGALLALARDRMPAGHYAQVTGAIPGADALVDEAVKQGLTIRLTKLSEVTTFLGRSGVSSEQVTRMVPVLTSAVEERASLEVVHGFTSALH